MNTLSFSVHSTAWETLAFTDNETVFEWWYGDRKLSIYLCDGEEPYYIQIHGKTVDALMTDGEVHSLQECIPLWEWLLEE